MAEFLDWLSNIHCFVAAGRRVLRLADVVGQHHQRDSRLNSASLPLVGLLFRQLLMAPAPGPMARFKTTGHPTGVGHFGGAFEG